MKPPTIGPTGAGVDAAAGEGAGELEGVLGVGPAAAGAVMDVVNTEFEVEAAKVLVGVEDGAAEKAGGLWVLVEMLRKLSQRLGL